MCLWSLIAFQKNILSSLSLKMSIYNDDKFVFDTVTVSSHTHFQHVFKRPSILLYVFTKKNDRLSPLLRPCVNLHVSSRLTNLTKCVQKHGEHLLLNTLENELRSRSYSFTLTSDMTPHNCQFTQFMQSFHQSIFCLLHELLFLHVL